VQALGMEGFDARAEEVKDRPRRQPTTPARPGDAPDLERPSWAAIDDQDAKLAPWTEAHHGH